MAETKDLEETTLPVKRKPEQPTSQDQPDFPNKSQKLQLSGNNSQQESGNRAELEDNADPQVEDLEEEEDSEEESIEKSEVDRKGKGIMRADKGKGILIEEEEEDDDDEEEEQGVGSSDDDSSSSDGGSEFDVSDSDLSDDPLAEVDLDNILPSRTRRRQVQPGVYIRSDNNGNNNQDQDDDSDESDD